MPDGLCARRPARHAPCRPSLRAGKLDEVSLFSDSSLLGPSSADASASKAKTVAQKLDELKVESEVRCVAARDGSRMLFCVTLFYLVAEVWRLTLSTLSPRAIRWAWTTPLCATS